MRQRTTFLARLLGLYCILVALFMVSHKRLMVEMVAALIHNPPALFAAGFIGAVCGLALILGHNIWSGGALSVIVTLMGWTALIKGLLLLFLSPEAASGLFLGELHYEQLFYVYAAFSFLLGGYLTYASRTGK